MHGWTDTGWQESVILVQIMRPFLPTGQKKPLHNLTPVAKDVYTTVYWYSSEGVGSNAGMYEGFAECVDVRST